MSRRSLAAIALALASSVARAQEEAPETGESNYLFFGLVMVALVVGPIVFLAVLAIRRARTAPSQLPVFDDGNFEQEVLESRVPVLVHFSRAWSVPDRATLAQTEILAFRNRGAIKVGILDIDHNPVVMEKLPGLEPPAYLLFYEGRKLFHRPGLQQADDLQEQIDHALSREGF